MNENNTYLMQAIVLCNSFRFIYGLSYGQNKYVLVFSRLGKIRMMKERINMF